jgi:hypothetical protein
MSIALPEDVRALLEAPNYVHLSMLRDPRVVMSVVDLTNPYRMAALQGRVLEVRGDEDCGYMDPISVKYTGKPFPVRGPGRVCFVIGVDRGAQRTLNFVRQPG